MAKLILILSLLFPAFTQPASVITQDKDFRQTGSAKTLSGKTYVLVIFVSQEGQQEWSVSDKTTVIKKIHKATRWIREKSSAFGYKIEFLVFSLGKKNDIKLKYIPKGPYEKLYSSDVIRQAMTASGYEDGFDLSEYARQNAACDNCIVLVASNAKGRSYALPQSREMYSRNIKSGCKPHQIEGCVLYNKYNSGLNIAAPTITHEILHLFGAVDLYYSKDDRQKNELAAKHFPNSIMRRVNYTFDKLEIDPITAYLTGLTNRCQDWYTQLIN